MLLQQEAEMKLDLRGAGGGMTGPGPGKMTAGAGHQQGPGPPVISHDKPVTNHVINPAVPKPSLDVRPASTIAPTSVPQAPSPVAPAPAPVKPVVPPPSQPRVAPPPKHISPQPTSDPRNNVSDIAGPSVNNKPVPVVAAPPPAPLLTAPTPRADVVTTPAPDPTVLRQPASLQISDQPSALRGRTPTRQERSRAAAAGQSNDVAAAGGYNFQKIMDDRFEHYKRPPSRERSADRFGSGSRQGSRTHLASRDASRDRLNQPVGAGARPGSRQRTPLVGQDQTFSENKNNGLDSLNIDSVASAKPAMTGNGSVAGGNNFSADLKLPAEDQIRYRGVQQEIPHFGAPPKRTESLYMKPSNNNQQATFKVKSLLFLGKLYCAV